MRHFDFIKNVNPKVIHDATAVRSVVSKILGLTRNQSLQSASYVVGTFIHIKEDLAICGAWGHLVKNKKYPYIHHGYRLISEPSPEEIQGDVLLTKGTSYILLDVGGKRSLVESDHAFSAI